MWIKRTGSRRKSRRGAAAVELALILIPLTTFVLAAIDFGRFAHGYIAVTNAARVGAGFASMHRMTTTTRPVWELRTREAVLTELGDGFGPDFAEENVTMPPPTITVDADGLRRVRVEVSYPFTTLVSWLGMWQNVTLRRAVEMRFTR